MINKVRRKTKKRMENLANSYKSTNNDGSALKRLMHDDEPEMDFDMTNQITMGQNRKMRKKLKKLKKKVEGEDADDKIFN